MVSTILNHRGEIAAICNRFGVHRLEVFGSAAIDGEFDPQRSDVDFIVEFRPGHDLGPWLSEYFALRDELSHTLGTRIDLVMSSAIKNEHFLREANRTRTLLYGS